MRRIEFEGAVNANVAVNEAPAAGQSGVSVARCSGRPAGAAHGVVLSRWSARRALVSALRQANEGDLERSARHQRLDTPMRLIDLAYFVAEHDDQHLARLRELTTTHATHS